GHFSSVPCVAIVMSTAFFFVSVALRELYSFPTRRSSDLSVSGLTASNTASGAGSTVIVCTCVIVRPQSSVYVQVCVSVPPHSSYVPVITPVRVPSIRHAPVSPLLYSRHVATTNGASSHVSVSGLTASNTAS